MNRITLEVKGMERVEALAEKLQQQINDLRQTLQEFGFARLELEAKLNAPFSEADG